MMLQRDVMPGVLVDAGGGFFQRTAAQLGYFLSLVDRQPTWIGDTTGWVSFPVGVGRPGELIPVAL